MPAPSTRPAPPARHRAACIALCALLLMSGCSHRPPASPHTSAAPDQAARTAAAPGSTADGPTTIVAVREVYRTQQVDKVARERCGERIVPPPGPPSSLWSRMFSSTPSTDDGEVPAPVFGRETLCDTVASERLQPARYRVVYSVGTEDYSVDLDYDPGAAVRLDATGHVLGPAALP